ncbi:hypothetical protein VTN96DRAFT_4893 [Rasamsonia emersonii]|uniref:Cysteine-rich PDZ-binding protein n=1 Tax=Rasamsonia emersonii (strain ATCC 16479 / CBS 393.64 / IMI 116815) TaxID=1408163 RepID=A0A0F4YXA3_RASE3|nr:Cript family protein [Rasamsonia emersonii CBS 393.64]KKA22243.1 Cript family protein [Rasamsonia emersonii CBS 393.64]
MVCAKCQKKLQKTELVTPGVKRKTDMYYGSPSSTLGAGGDAKAKPTLGNTGVSKNKLLSQKAKNPYAAYSSSCEVCKTKTEQGRKYCQRCAYQRNACPMCGKSLNAAIANAPKDQPVIQTQKFNTK